jgi:hypothetical protein
LCLVLLAVALPLLPGGIHGNGCCNPRRVEALWMLALLTRGPLGDTDAGALDMTHAGTTGQVSEG